MQGNMGSPLEAESGLPLENSGKIETQELRGPFLFEVPALLAGTLDLLGRGVAPSRARGEAGLIAPNP